MQSIDKEYEELTWDDVVDGIYYLQHESSRYIFDYKLDTTEIPVLEPDYDGGKFHFTDFDKDDDDFNIRLATPLEIRWLKSCIKAEQFVKCPKNIDTYEIY